MYHSEFPLNTGRRLSPEETIKSDIERCGYVTFDHSCRTPLPPPLYYTSEHQAQAPSRRSAHMDIHLQLADDRTRCPGLWQQEGGIEREVWFLNIYGPRIWSQASQQHSEPLFPTRCSRASRLPPSLSHHTLLKCH